VTSDGSGADRADRVDGADRADRVDGADWADREVGRVLDPQEAAATAEQFGVQRVDVLRDHLISHLLAVLAPRLGDRLVLFGGMALARTHLPAGRLSEDVELFAVPSRARLVADLERVLATGVRREYGVLVWEPAPSAVDGSTVAVLRSVAGLVVRVRLLDPAGHAPWPTEHRELVQRYSDVPAARFHVPTRAASAASTTAWHTGGAVRDLYDLWGLARAGALDVGAADLFARLGPTGRRPSAELFDRAPAAADWQTQLAGQTRAAVASEEALATVRDAWVAVAG